MDKLRKWLTVLINILYIPIGTYLFSINNEAVVLQWISEINVFLSDKHYITYAKLNKFLLVLSLWAIILFVILKVIRFFLKSDIRKLEKQNKNLLSTFLSTYSEYINKNPTSLLNKTTDLFWLNDEKVLKPLRYFPSQNRFELKENNTIKKQFLSTRMFY